MVELPRTSRCVSGWPKDFRAIAATLRRSLPVVVWFTEPARLSPSWPFGGDRSGPSGPRALGIRRPVFKEGADGRDCRSGVFAGGEGNVLAVVPGGGLAAALVNARARWCEAVALR